MAVNDAIETDTNLTKQQKQSMMQQLSKSNFKRLEQMRSVWTQYFNADAAQTVPGRANYMRFFRYHGYLPEEKFVGGNAYRGQGAIPVFDFDPYNGVSFENAYVGVDAKGKKVQRDYVDTGDVNDHRYSMSVVDDTSERRSINAAEDFVGRYLPNPYFQNEQDRAIYTDTVRDMLNSYKKYIPVLAQKEETEETQQEEETEETQQEEETEETNGFPGETPMLSDRQIQNAKLNNPALKNIPDLCFVRYPKRYMPYVESVTRKRARMLTYAM